MSQITVYRHLRELLEQLQTLENSFSRAFLARSMPPVLSGPKISYPDTFPMTKLNISSHPNPSSISQKSDAAPPLILCVGTQNICLHLSRRKCLSSQTTPLLFPLQPCS